MTVYELVRHLVQFPPDTEVELLSTTCQRALTPEDLGTEQRPAALPRLIRAGYAEETHPRRSYMAVTIEADR